MKHSISLSSGEIVEIREARKSDAASLITYVNQVGGESDFLTFGGGEFSKTVEEEEAIIENHRRALNRIFLIAEIEGEIAGILNVNAGAKARMQHIGTFGITVQKKYWGYGIGSLLMKAMIDWAKANPIIRKINLEVLTDNPSAIALYKKFGFEIEGTIRRSLFLDGKFSDSYAMGLLID
ncbi:MAG: GNAT family N-acetyltransferase [Bacteroidia bacterium]|nr:GNAT family N-acetyltransferase [Bacteroidia bacterium]